jgi:two-component system phosphate regulon sensor histidine kinase PhoR
MTGKIFRSTLLVALTVLLTGLTVMAGFLFDYFDDVQERHLREELTLSATATEQFGVDYLRQLGEDADRHTWIAPDGTVLYDTQAEAAAMESHADRTEIQQALTTGWGRSARFSTTRMEKTLYEACRLSDGSILRISASSSTSLMLVMGMLPMIFLVALLAAGLSALLAHRVAKRVVQPINQLDLEHPLENHVYDELSPLLQRLHAQRQQISRQMSQLKQAERSRREFSANVSHELKTPLQSILGSAGLIENGMLQPEDVPRFVGHIHREAARLVTLIDDIIRLSQLDEGVELPRECVDLRQVAEDVLDTLQDAAGNAGVSLTVTGQGTVMGVHRLLDDVICNLCENAIKYNRPGGTVAVEIGETKQETTLRVRDTGIGIPSEHHQRIFERFYRVDKSHSRASGGTGLGLSIVKHAVQFHNGTIALQSEPGVGTEITVTFPKD